MGFWTPNIKGDGRKARFALAVAFLFATIALMFAGFYILAAVSGFTALFVFFEAARGWCLARACGIKTKV